MTAYEMFLSQFKTDNELFKDERTKEGAYRLSNDVKLLEKMQMNMSYFDLVDLFGEQLGNHLWDKFIHESNRNILSWLRSLTAEYRFFLMSQLCKGKWGRV